MSGYRDEITRFLESKGLSPQVVAGILGNWMVESSLSPTAYNAREGAVGFAQWEGGRRQALRQWALTHHGADETDAQSQLEFFWHELTTQYSGVLDQLKHAHTAADAAAIFDQHYEVSSGSTRQQRINYASQFYSGSGPNPTYSGPGANADAMSSGGNAGTGGSQHMKASDYASVDSLGSLLNSVPDLRHLVDKAVAENWSADEFQNQVEDSKWWKTHSNTARQAIIQRANDPASFNQLLSNTETSVINMSRQLGFPVSAASARAIANTALLTGNDSNQAWISQQLAHHHDYSHLGSTAGLTGQMAQTVQQLSQLASDYGYKYTPAAIAERAQNILDGYTTIDTYKQSLISWAKSTFPGLAEQIDGGQTVKQLADPYVNSMSQLLEVDPGTLDTFTPAIRKAMQGAVDPQTKQRAATPLWQFEDQVRQDPRWAYTNNARDTMSTALVKVGADFGFGPSA